MFIGHFGVGFGAKKISSLPSLGTMFLAAQFIDLLWPIFILLGIEKVTIVPGGPPFKTLDFTYYPFSHSLFGVVIWSLLFGLIYYFVKKNLRGSVLLGGLVLSHWVLDFFTHVPDLPIFLWSDTKVGLGLWNSPAATIIIEVLIYLAGAFLYLRYRKEQNKKGLIGTIGLVFVLLLIYIISSFGSASLSVEAIGYSGLGLWIFVAWAYWIDRKVKVVN